MKNNIQCVESLNALILFAGSEYFRNPSKFGIKFRKNIREILKENPYFIPVDSWYSENPYIDHQVRLERVGKIVAALKSLNIKVGGFATRTIETLKNKGNVLMFE